MTETKRDRDDKKKVNVRKMADRPPSLNEVRKQTNN